jgi:hypothetical protein
MAVAQPAAERTQITGGMRAGLVYQQKIVAASRRLHKWDCRDWLARIRRRAHWWALNRDSVELSTTPSSSRSSSMI